MNNDEVMRITEKLSAFLSNEIAAMTRDERIFTPRDIENAVYQGIRAAYEAGEIAMKEKAAELRESLKLICAEAESWHTMHDHDGNGLVQCDSICALIPRMKAALSGAEEATKESHDNKQGI